MHVCVLFKELFTTNAVVSLQNSHYGVHKYVFQSSFKGAFLQLLALSSSITRIP